MPNKGVFFAHIEFEHPVIGLTELPNSGWAKAQPAHPLAAALQCARITKFIIKKW